ncbi:hypothetical protein [Acidovorax sp. PRC11]|uniref:hypothetical protein n=1 Tax=Acidovorax sp. PRC11 TaxID=2962592 RepID=UPI002882896F|nr:hypothetical protein [Acidovorax sp. PRC11]MDT0140217.1 hypothetical protein [Acidovorax sp. PRC11]
MKNFLKFWKKSAAIEKDCVNTGDSWPNNEQDEIWMSENPEDKDHILKYINAQQENNEDSVGCHAAGDTECESITEEILTKRIYHGTTLSNLLEKGFIIPEPGRPTSTGEMQSPIKGIWFAEYERGAREFAKLTCAHKNGGTGYVYECELINDPVVANTLDKRLPRSAEEKFLSLYAPKSRLFPNRRTKILKKIEKMHWLHYVTEKSCAGIDPGDSKQKNALLDILRKIGVDVLLNPLARTSEVDGGVQSFSGSYNFGTIVLVLNLKNIKIVKVS